MQQGFLTPIKNIYSHQKKQFNSDVAQREGDWVCLNCQNLNYSFRKKCNRCKIQTRLQNQACSVYSYYYYQELDGPVQAIAINYKPISQGNGSTTSHSGALDMKEFQEQNKQNYSFQSIRGMQTPKKKKQIFSEDSKLDGLPSVSPLVRKYRQKQQHTTLSKIKSLKSVQSQPKYSFQNIRIRDFDKLIQDVSFAGTFIQGSPYKQGFDEEDSQGFRFMQDIEDSISRIMI